MHIESKPIEQTAANKKQVNQTVNVQEWVRGLGYCLKDCNSRNSRVLGKNFGGLPSLALVCAAPEFRGVLAELVDTHATCQLFNYFPKTYLVPKALFHNLSIPNIKLTYDNLDVTSLKAWLEGKPVKDHKHACGKAEQRRRMAKCRRLKKKMDNLKLKSPSKLIAERIEKGDIDVFQHNVAYDRVLKVMSKASKGKRVTPPENPNGSGVLDRFTTKLATRFTKFRVEKKVVTDNRGNLVNPAQQPYQYKTLPTTNCWRDISKGWRV